MRRAGSSPSTASDTFDAIIIGAGMSGLAAGIRLAQFDRRVCVLERHTTIGGLNSFYRLGGRNYDVGLHAVTNFAPKGAKAGPLARVLRQLRFRWDDFALAEQLGSAVAFPGVTLEFSNDFALLESEVRRAFPSHGEGFRRLAAALLDYGQLDESIAAQSARSVVAEYLNNPLLVDMLLCPLMFYGSARPADMDFGQFSIMFRSIFLEGFARPFAGVRLILKNLVRRYKELGGVLRLRAGVDRLEIRKGNVERVVLDDGSELSARRVLSSAGWVETMRLCNDGGDEDGRPAGELSFVEAVSVLDRMPSELGHDRTVVFYNNSPRFAWEKPNDLVDVRSGVICSPNNFAYERPLDEGIIRITSLANYERWKGLAPEEYRLAKRGWYEKMTAAATRFVPDFRGAVVDTDIFTPTTIRRYTGHDNGAVYGAPKKQPDGTTHLGNLFICGTDQGFVGIIGAMVSGISMANRHLLPDRAGG